MPEILTREQIEAYRDSPSRLVTDFDREMARAGLAALDHAEAAETALQAWCKAFGTTQLTHAVARLEAAKHERDAARAEVARHKDITASALQQWAEMLEDRTTAGEERDEARAEAADLRSQLAACAEESGARPCEGCARPSVTTDSEGVPLCHECYVGCICDDVVKPLQAEVARLKAENMCDACAGQGTALSGPCMCGGTGKMSDAAVYLRTEVARLKDKLVSLAGALAMIAQQNVQGTQEWQAGVEYMQETARAALENHKEVQP